MRMVYVFLLCSFVDEGNENGIYAYVVFIRGWRECEWYMCVMVESPMRRHSMTTSLRFEGPFPLLAFIDFNILFL